MRRAKLLEQFVFAWHYGISCAYSLFYCLLKSAHIASRMRAPYASKKSIKMGLKDHQLFPMEQISVTKIQGRTNVRQNCSRVDAALKENLEFFVFLKFVDPWQKLQEVANPRSSSSSPRPRLDCRSTSRRPGVA